MRNGASAILLAAVLTLPVSNAAAVPYTFSKLYDSSGSFNDFGLPSLNNSGTVAFAADFDTGGSGIFTGRGGPTTTIVDTSGPFDHFGGYSLNNNGTVAFQAFLGTEDRSGGIFTGSGGPRTTIVTVQGEDAVHNLSINDNATVAFLASLQVAEFRSIFTGSGGPLRTLYDAEFVDFVPFNDSGTVAFVAFLGPSDDGIVTGSGGPTTTIAARSGPFTSFFSGDENPQAAYVLNDSGTVAFVVGLDTGEFDFGLFTGSGGPITTIADNSGPFSFFGGGAGEHPGFSLNNSGTVAFRAFLDTGAFGIFTGPDPLADEVISLGDSLFGSTVTDILIRDESLNDAGQIAFFYELADGRTGIALADPRAILEPGTLALLGLGLAGLGLTRRRRAA